MRRRKLEIGNAALAIETRIPESHMKNTGGCKRPEKRYGYYRASVELT
jgi:hypothetical protein